MPLALRAFVIVLLACLPAGLLHLRLEGELREARLERTEEEALRLAQFVNAEQARVVDATRQLLNALVTHEAIAGEPSSDCAAYLGRVLAAVPRYLAAWSLRPGGTVACAAGAAPPGEAGPRADFARAAAQAGASAFAFPLGGAPVLWLAQPLAGGAGYVALGLDPAWLLGTLEALDLPEGATALLATGAGTVLARRPDGTRFLGTDLRSGNEDIFAAAAPGVVDRTSLDGTRRLIGYVPPASPPQGLYVAVGLSPGAVTAAAEADRRRALLLVASFLGTLLALVLGFHLVVSRPVRALLEAAARWRGGAMSARVGAIGGGREFQRLGAAFDAMAAGALERERARRANEGRLRTLLDLSPQVVFTADPEGRLTWVSRHWTALTGQERDEALGPGVGWFAAFHPEDRARVQAEWREAVGRAPSSDAGFSAEARLLEPDGEGRWHLLRGAPVRGEDGALLGWAGVMSDVHALKLAEGAAAAGAATLAATYAGAPVALALLDGEGRVALASEELGALAGGRRAAELRGRPLAEAVPILAAAEGLAAGVAASGAPLLEAEIAGEGRSFLANLSPVRDGSGRVTGVSAVFLEVTERRRAEQRERLLAREVDHRAKNVLAVVRSLVRLSVADSATDAAKLVDSLEGRLGAMSRAHALLSEARWDGADLADLARGEVAPVAGQVALEGPSVPLRPEAAQPLAMALHELVSNALRHGSLSAPGGSATLSWARAGEGAEILWRERGGPGAATAKRAVGFGLRLMDGAVEAQLDGRVERSWGAEGLECRIRLGAAALAQPAAPLRGRRILLAEDEPVIALDLAATLRALGCEVLGPAATPRAVEALARRADAAVLDVELRGGSVIPVARALRRAGLPLVFVTGAEAPPEDFEGVPVLGKPARPAEIQAALEAVLAAEAGAGGRRPVR